MWRYTAKETADWVQNDSLQEVEIMKKMGFCFMLSLEMLLVFLVHVCILL